MTVDVLFSGSRGNCTYIKSGVTEILIDCGKSARKIACALRELGTDISNISALFITHEHTDHTSALETLCAASGVPVHMTERSAASCKTPSIMFTACTHPDRFCERIGDLTVESFPLPHDSACHVGYIITDKDGDTFGIATDMGHVTEEAIDELSRCRRVMIEANHDVELLRYGRYPAFLKARILSPKGHLSNEDCAHLACTLADRGCEVIALAHLSPENNTPQIAYSEVRRALDSEGYAGCEVVVTDREETVEIPKSPRTNTEEFFEYAED